MRLDKPEEAEIPRAKIVDYLLSLTHKDGRGKAIFFLSFGFLPESWELLADALRQHAQENDIVKVESSPFGTRFVVEGPLKAADGRTPRVRSVWFVDTGALIARLATAYPLEPVPDENRELSDQGVKKNGTTGTG